MTPRWRESLLLLLAGLVLSLGSGGDDDKDSKQKTPKPANTPEIVSSGGGSSTPGPTMGTLPPPIISSGPGPGAGILTLIAPSVAGSNAPALPGLTIRHSETGSVPADQAFVVLQMQSRVGPSPSGSLSLRDQEQVTAALTAIGVKKEDIHFDSGANYVPFPTISVQTPLPDLQTQGKKIVDAAESILGRSQSGVRFGLSDCHAALDPLRKKAIDAAADEAKALAQASGLSLGPITSLSQTVNGGSNNPSGDPCNAAVNLQRGITVPAGFDSPATVNLKLEAVVTYGLGDGTTQSGLTATGSGKAVAKADEAYIVVTVSTQSGPTGPAPISKKNRDDVTQKLKALKFNDDDIDIESGPYGGQIAISVETPLDRLPQAGKDVASAVEDVFGRSTAQGVWLTHSNCTAVLTEARKQAVADARRSAEALGAAAQVKPGNLIAISEVNQTPSVGIAVPSPCPDDVTSLFISNGGYNATASLQPFDAKAEFTVTTTLAATYAIGP